MNKSNLKHLDISIITVTMNSEETLAETENSVLNQTYLPKEYLIIDGCSKDGTLAVAEQFRAAFEEKGIIYKVISEPDSGIYEAMNKGIRLSSGEVIGMINSDDWYEPCALETVSRVYLEKGFDLFFADLRMHMPGGAVFIKHSRNRKYATSRDWNHPTTFATKTLYNRFQYKNDTIHDDYDLILRVKKAGAHIEIENKVLANFRMNGTSHERSIKKAWQRVKIKYGIYRNNGYSPLYFFECAAVEAAKLFIG